MTKLFFVMIIWLLLVLVACSSEEKVPKDSDVSKVKPEIENYDKWEMAHHAPPPSPTPIVKKIKKFPKKKHTKKPSRNQLDGL